MTDLKDSWWRKYVEGDTLQRQELVNKNPMMGTSIVSLVEKLNEEHPDMVLKSIQQSFRLYFDDLIEYMENEHE